MEDITRNAERKVNEGADKVREGVDRARKQTVDTLEKAYPMADEAIEKAKAKGEEIWDRAKNKGQDFLDDIEANGQEVWGKVTGYIKKRPVQAIGCALLLGLAVGAIVAASNRD